MITYIASLITHSLKFAFWIPKTIFLWLYFIITNSISSIVIFFRWIFSFPIVLELVVLAVWVGLSILFMALTYEHLMKKSSYGNMAEDFNNFENWSADFENGQRDNETWKFNLDKIYSFVMKTYATVKFVAFFLYFFLIVLELKFGSWLVRAWVFGVITSIQLGWMDDMFHKGNLVELLRRGGDVKLFVIIMNMVSVLAWMGFWKLVLSLVVYYLL
jgi:hypothetical protein